MKDDLISRQAAIDAVTKHFRIDNDLLEVIVYEMERLPSAQPEIIHCEDCEWWEKQKDSLQGRCELMQMYPTGAWYCANAKKRGRADTGGEQDEETEE